MDQTALFPETTDIDEVGFVLVTVDSMMVFSDVAFQEVGNFGLYAVISLFRL